MEFAMTHKKRPRIDSESIQVGLGRIAQEIRRQVATADSFHRKLIVEDDELRDMLHSVPVPAERMERLRQTWPVSLRGSMGPGSPVESAGSIVQRRNGG